MDIERFAEELSTIVRLLNDDHVRQVYTYSEEVIKALQSVHLMSGMADIKIISTESPEGGYEIKMERVTNFYAPL